MTIKIASNQDASRPEPRGLPDPKSRPKSLFGRTLDTFRVGGGYPTKLLAATLAITLFTPPAHAVSKEIVQLQTQIQQLQDAVARLTQANDERMGSLKDLVQQSADSVNRMSLNMDALQRQMKAQQEAETGKLDQVSTQVQSLNDSLDETKARIARLEKLLQDIQSTQQQQSAGAAAGAPSASLGNQPASAAPLPLTPGNIADPVVAPAPVGRRGGKPSAAAPLAAAPATPSAPPIDDLYRTAYNDYMAAKYPLASAEFSDVIHAYPDQPLAGNAHYYLGEIEYREGHYAAAEKDYDNVLEQFPGNTKIPAAHLHKGQALIVQKQTDAGVREFRALIARFPNTPEATQARSKLNAMGIPIKARS